MPPAAGVRLGLYELLAPLGVGGMGDSLMTPSPVLPAFAELLSRLKLTRFAAGR